MQSRSKGLKSAGYTAIRIDEVLHKAVDDITPEEQSVLVRELEPHVLRCVKDANGNHVSLLSLDRASIFTPVRQVIQKLIECVSGERLTFVSAFQGHVDELAMHPYGCRVLQRCFEHLVPELTRPLLDELHQYTLTLMQDSFGVSPWIRHDFTALCVAHLE